MTYVRTKSRNAAYTRRRAARQKLGLLQARFAAGLDSSGMRPDELLKVAQIKVDLEQARFTAITRSQHPRVVADTFGEIISELSALSLTKGKTPEFDNALNDLFDETFESKAGWENSYPTKTDEVSDDDN